MIFEWEWGGWLRLCKTRSCSSLLVWLGCRCFVGIFRVSAEFIQIRSKFRLTGENRPGQAIIAIPRRARMQSDGQEDKEDRRHQDFP